MKVIKPSWVCGGEALFTVDIHPDGLKFATGGQGADTGNGRIVIWYMQPVKSSKSENSCSNKQIACLDHHQGCVNCVRWSCSGHLLASASDDKVVMLWQTVRYEGSTSESHKCQHILRGHDGDVLDLAWSHDDLKLASSSIDNTVIVWDGTNFPEKLTRIRGHDGMVKGVVWDPIGRYLASQSTDRTLRVWRSSDWKEEGQVTEPFKNCGGTTTVLRLGWSPDGRYIVSSHAMNNEGPVAKIIERDDWKASMDFVGHRRAIESVRFNPHLFLYKATNSPASCVAIAGRDCSVSVWLTALKRPLFVLHDVFSSSVLDMSWTPDGYGLIACSLDGSVVYIELTSKDLGKTLTHKQTEDIKMKEYGKVVTEKPSTIIENPELMDLPQTNGMSQSTSPEKSNSSFQTEEDEDMDTTPSPPPSANSNGFSSKPATQKDVEKSMEIKRQQVESKTKDGKRRIMPVTLKVVATPVKVPAIRKINLQSVPVEKRQAPEAAFESSNTIQFGAREEPSISMMKVPTKLSKRMRTNPPATSPALNNFTLARQKVSSLEIQDKLFTSTKDHQIEICNTSRTISCKGVTSWSSALCTKATSLSAHNGVIIIGCSEGGVHVLTLSGERLLPILNVGDSVLRTAISETCVAVISTAPALWLWDFKKKTNLIKAENLACFISESCSITQLKVQDGGVVLGLSNGTSYTYSQDLKSWLLLNSTDADSKWLNVDNSLLSSLTSVTSSKEGKEGEVKLRTIMILEQQVMIAESLKSNKEGRQWICSLVRYLTKCADEVRLKSLFQKYISSSTDTVLGFPRLDIINELLNIVRDNVELQRLYSEIKQQLVWLENRQ